MRDLDELVQALRDEADALPAAVLLPGVRDGARRLRRRRVVEAAIAVTCVVVAVLGIGIVLRGQSRPAGSASALKPEQMTDPVWYLTGWTSAGIATAAATDQAPTLAFHDPRHAVTVIPNRTTWSVRVGSGTLDAREDETTAQAMSAGTLAVYEALTAVLPGRSTWQVTGTLLVIRQGSRSLRFTSEPAAGAQGEVRVKLVAHHGAGVVSRGSGPVAGQIRLTRKDGRGYDTAGVGRQGMSIGLAAGDYVLTATISDGTCAPLSVTVPAAKSVSVVMSCRDGLSTD